MNVRISRLLAALGALALVASSGAATAGAAPVPVKVSVTNLRCIQTYAVNAKEDDQVYLTVSGVAKGAEVARRVPESGTLPANTKTQPVSEKEPLALWEGELADGEFALVTVALFQGKGDEPAGKAFAGKLDEAAKGVAERSKKTLASADELKALAAATQKAQHAVATTAKEALARDKNTDHFGGLFNVVVWNNNGTLVKRLDPLGLTFGEHYGNDAKAYTKIKWTRNNVLAADPDGQFYPKEMPPVSEDKLTIRVKMLENDYFKNEKGRNVKNTTDYLADVQVAAAGQPVPWALGKEVINPATEQSKIHMFWEWAE